MFSLPQTGYVWMRSSILCPSMSTEQWPSLPQLRTIPISIPRRLVSVVELKCIVILFTQINLFLHFIAHFCSTWCHIFHNYFCDFIILNVVYDPMMYAIFSFSLCLLSALRVGLSNSATRCIHSTIWYL